MIPTPAQLPDFLRSKMVDSDAGKCDPPRLPGNLDNDRDREQLAVWCSRVLGVRVEWFARTLSTAAGTNTRRTALVGGSRAMVAMVSGLIATFPRPCGELAIRVLRVEPLPGGAP